MQKTVVNLTTGTQEVLPLTPSDIAATPPQWSAGVPNAISRFQAKAALDGWQLLTAAESLMAQEQTPQIIKLAWSEAVEFRRESPAVIAMGTLLSLDSDQLDQLFITGAEITV